MKWVRATYELDARSDLRALKRGDGSRLFKDQRVVAFCGWATPMRFGRPWGMQAWNPVACYEYDDHHRYTPSEIRRLARNSLDSGAEALLTTAKDAVNLDEAELANLIRQRI